jgi:DNA processing protein
MSTPALCVGQVSASHQIHPKSERYPHLLSQISSPPVLYTKGQLPPEMRGVACVGTRNPTHWGQVVTKRIVHALVDAGYSIISGLATGVDAIAHQAAIEAGGHTVAVLPCSIDEVYPKHHRKLADRILASGGALVTPFAPGYKMNRGSFVRRNRIQSGLSVATMIMQCGPDSGTMHTARFTQKQGRLLCVASPSGRYESEPQSRGNLELLALSDALAIRSKSDYDRLITTLQST